MNLKPGDYLKVDRFEILESFMDQEPIYSAVVGDAKIPIAPAFSCLVEGAKGIELRKDPIPGFYSNNENKPYVWVPVYYDRSN